MQILIINIIKIIKFEDEDEEGEVELLSLYLL